MNRKFKGYLIAVGLLIIGYVITHVLGISDNLFKTFIYGLIALTGLYDGANVINKKLSNGGKKGD